MTGTDSQKTQVQIGFFWNLFQDLNYKLSNLYVPPILNNFQQINLKKNPPFQNIKIIQVKRIGGDYPYGPKLSSISENQICRPTTSRSSSPHFSSIAFSTSRQLNFPKVRLLVCCISFYQSRAFRALYVVILCWRPPVYVGYTSWGMR